MREQGTRFTLVYLERGVPAQDNQRLRNRLAAYFGENLQKYHGDNIRKALQKEAGIEVPWFANFGYSVSDVLKKGELRDFLDSITLIYQALPSSLQSSWHGFVDRAIREENVGHRLDSRCGVHYFVDQEYERNRVATLSVLDADRYGAVRAAYEDAFRHMDSTPMDTKAAVRSLFESLEILTKMMVSTQNLNRWVVENSLKEKCLSLTEPDPANQATVTGLLSSMASWVHSIHNYRHGHATEQPNAPGVELAVYIISTGSAHLRWLSQFHNVIISKD